MQKIRYAVIGAGWISQEAFIPSVAYTGNSKVTAIISGDTKKARTLADFHDIEHVYHYDALETALLDDVFDVAYIALPNSLHARYSILCANAGKHILVEKPLAVTIEESKAMIAAAKTNNVYLMTAYRLHHDPATLTFYDRIWRGDIGDVRFFSSVFSFNADQGNHRLKAEHWGGPLQDLGVYCINAARHVFQDEPIAVTAVKSQGDQDTRFTEIEETYAVTLTFPRGRIAQFIASFGADQTDVMTVVGTKGALEMSPGYQFQYGYSIKHRIGMDIVETPFDQVDHFGGQVAYFSDCIISKIEPESNGQEGLLDMEIMIAVERAAATGKSVALNLERRDRRPHLENARAIPITQKRLVL
jgi:predicted dehydrogenase